MKPLKPRKNDITFIDPKTGKKCSWNECYKKFTIEGTNAQERTPRWNDFNKIEFDAVCHVCEECGRKVSNREDRAKSKKNYFDSAFSVRNNKS